MSFFKVEGFGTKERGRARTRGPGRARGNPSRHEKPQALSPEGQSVEDACICNFYLRGEWRNLSAPFRVWVISL